MPRESAREADRFDTAAARPVDRIASAEVAARAVTAPADETSLPLVAAGPLVVRTARLTLLPADFDAARTEIDRLTKMVGGFTGRMVVSGGRGTPRTLSMTLRVPAPRLDETVAALKRLGEVSSEGHDGEDVTQQSVDLDARLTNARASEKRLQAILQNRTGKLSEVLDVEREIARVRGDIEEMEAARASLDRRITYATISLEMSEERKVAVDLGPLPVSTQLRNAMIDGWTSAVHSGLDVAIFIIRMLPVLTLWLLILAWPAWLLKRKFLAETPSGS